MSTDAELPPGWAWVNIGELAESMKNGLYKEKHYYAVTGTACLRMYNIEGGRLSLHELKYLKLTDEEIREYGLESGDLLVNRVNSRELVVLC